MSKTLVCKKSDVPDNGMKAFGINGCTVLILNAGPLYFACQSLCPHQEVALEEGLFDGATLTCHEHLWQWDIASGEPIGLAEEPLQTYDLSIEGDEIWIDASQLRDTAVCAGACGH